MKYIICLLLLFATEHTQANSTNESIEVIKSLIPSLSGTTSKIKTLKCNYKKEKWAEALVTKNSFEEKLTFNPQCDFEGNFTVLMDKFFPLNLKIKDHPKFTNLKSQVKFEILFEEQPTLYMTIKNLELTGKESLSANFKYGIYMDILNKDPFKRHKGGELEILKVNKKTIKKKFPVNFQ